MNKKSEDFPEPESDINLNRYISFINSRKESSTGYFEAHHIVPRSLGGSDDKDNIINITAREHYVAHMILWKSYGGSMTTAFWFMNNAKREHSFKLSSRLYESLRIEISTKRKEEYCGKNNPFYGKIHSEETKKIWSEKQKKVKGWKHSNETKNKMSKSQAGEKNPSFGKIYINNDKEMKFILKVNWPKYEKLGYSKGMLVDRKGSKNAFFGKTHSKEVMDKIKQKTKNRVRIHRVEDGIRVEGKMVHREELDRYLNDNWKLGRGKSQCKKMK